MSNTIGELVVKLGIDPAGLDQGATKAEARLEQMGTRLYFLGSRITAAFSAPLGIAVGMIAKFGNEFDQAMTESLAIMDRVTPEMRSRMESTARTVSETTKYSAAEAATAYYSLASAGLNAAQSVDALPVAARFAQAGVMDLGKAAESLTAIQTALGLKTGDAAQNIVNMTRVSDVLVEVNNRALGKISDYTVALERSGGSLKLYNKTVEEGAAVLGAYASKGIVGANAGQYLYMVLRDLTSAAVKQPEHFQRAGIAVFDAAGKMRNMADIIDDLTRRFGPLSDESKRQELLFLGLTSRSQSALLPLMGMGDTVRSLEVDLRKAGGTTQEVADKQMTSLRMAFTLLWRQVQNTAIELFTSFVPVLRDSVIPALQAGINVLKSVAQWFMGLGDTGKLTTLVLVGVGIAIGPVIVAAAGLMLTLRGLMTLVTANTGALAILTGAYQTNAIAALEDAGANNALAVALARNASTSTLAAIASSERFAGSMVLTATKSAALKGVTEDLGITMTRAAARITGANAGATALEAVMGFLGTTTVMVTAAVAGLVLGVRFLTGSWDATYRFFDTLLLGSLTGLWNVLKGGANVVIWVGKTILDTGTVMLGWGKIAFDALSVVATGFANLHSKVMYFWNEMPNVVKSVWEVTRSFNPLAFAMDHTREGFSFFHQMLIDVVPGLREAESWLGRVASTAAEKWSEFTQIGRDAAATIRGVEIPAIKALTESYEGLMRSMKFRQTMDAWAPPPTPTGNDVFMNATGMSIDDYLKQTHPDAPGAGSDPSDPKKTGKQKAADTRARDLYERLSGYRSYQDAQVWDEVFSKFDPANMTSGDRKSAMDVYTEALRYMQISGMAGPGMYDDYNARYVQLAKLNGLGVEDVGMDSEAWSKFGKNLPGAIGLEGENVLKDPRLLRRFGPLTPGGPKYKIGTDFSTVASSFLSGTTSLSSEFSKLSQITDGKMSDDMQALGEFFATGSIAGKSGAQFKKGLSGLKGSKGVGGKMVAGAQMGESLLGAYSAFMSATDNSNQALNVLGGAQTGMQFGMQVGGPVGAAIGAGVGAIAAAIKGRPEWAKLGDDVARDLGVRIPTELAKKMAETSKTVGRQAAESLFLKDIVAAAGGLNEVNFDRFAKTFRDTFSMIETGKISVTDATKVLDENFAAFAEAGTDAYGRLGTSMREVIRLNDQFGTRSKAVADYLKGQASVAVEGFSKVVSAMVGPFLQSTEAVGQLQSELKKLEAEGKRGTQEWSDTQDKLNGQMRDQSGLAREAGQSLNDLGIMAVSSYAAAVAAGKPASEVLRSMAPSLVQMSDLYKRLGIDVENVALKSLMIQANIQQSNPVILDAIGGLGSSLMALNNMGLLNVDTFGAMERTGMQLYSRLQGAVAAAGGTTRDALLPMQDYLRKAELAAKDLGIPLDDNTQMLIDQSKELGIWKDAGKSATDKMLDGLNRMIDRMDVLISRLSNVPDVDFNINGRLNIDTGGVTGTGGKPLPDILIPEMAEGGITQGPTLAMIGEGAEQEAVLPLSRLNRMIQEVSASSEQTITVISTLDGAEIARNTVRYMPTVLRQNGIY